MAVDDWTYTTIGEQATLQRGFDITKTQQKAGKIPVVSSGGISSFHEEAVVKGPGVVLGRKGVVGSVYFLPADYWPHDTTLWVKDFHGNLPRFVYYFFKHLAPQLARLDVGSANPTLNRNHVHPTRVLWPLGKQQQVIAHILGTLDDKIELNRRMNETLEAMARAIFKSWFVDFDPVRAKAEGRQPDGMDADTAALFPDSFEDSLLGKIPNGWKVSSFDQSVEIWSGGTPKTSIDAYWNGDIPWFTVTGAPSASDIFVIDTGKYITRAGVDKSATRLLPVGTTIISARGTVGKLAIVGRPMAMNQTCYGLKGKKGYPDPFIYFQTKALVEELKQRTHGCVFDTIIRDTFKMLEVASPPPNVAEAFGAKVEPILQKIYGNLLESRTLAAIRDALLPKLLSGEVRIKDAERWLEARR